MSVMLTDSACYDCKWIDSCMIFKRINGVADSRKFKPNSNHSNDIIEIVIRKCSMKNMNRNYKHDK